MKTEVAIIGGGVAGLSAAIRLGELGVAPLVIEAGCYPAHKICGEFLSPESLDKLNCWNIHPVPITHATLNTTSSSLSFPFETPAGGLSHIHLDPSLADRAAANGAEIKTETKLSSFQPKAKAHDPHLLILSNGEQIEATNVIFATGRIPNSSSLHSAPAFMGFKTHFDNSNCTVNHLEMFSFKSAYLGISPVEENKVNVACLADLRSIQDTDPLEFIEKLIETNHHLASILNQRTNLLDHWMITPIPPFGIKSTPDWIDCYFIGDAAVTVPPACGNGLSMAIAGGCLSAEYAIRKEYQTFKKVWLKRCSSQLYWAQILHKIMLNPLYGNPLIGIVKVFPSIGTKLFESSRI